MKKAVSAVLAAMLLAVPLSAAAGGLGGLVPHINTSGSQRAVNNMENRTYTFNTLPASAAEVGPSTEARQVAAYAVAALTLRRRSGHGYCHAECLERAAAADAL